MHFYGFDRDLQPAFQRAQIRKGAPRFDVYTRAVYFPAGTLGPLSCLYDESGALIPASCVLRGPAKDENVSEVPPYMPSGRQYESVGGNFLFLVHMELLDYGHLLTEGLARVWFLLRHRREALEGQVLDPTFGLARVKLAVRSFLQRGGGGRFRTIAGYLGLDRHPSVAFSKPVRLEQVVVPEPSFVIRAEAHEVHKWVCDQIADRVLDGQGGVTDRRPLYLSRRKLRSSRRKVENEHEIEAFIRSAGGEVVYPERLTLEKQIRLFNQRRTVIGCIGSALHTLLFSRSADIRAVYLSGPQPNPNNFMIDRLAGVQSHYVNCLMPGGRAGKDRILDCEKAIRFLDEIIR